MNNWAKVLGTMLVAFLLTAPANGQQKVLVGNGGEVIPLKNGQSAAEAIQQYEQEKAAQAPGTCQTPFIGGYPPAMFPPDTIIHVHHKDVVASWFQAPANATIDSVFWQTGPSAGAPDSMVVLRIHHSNVGPGSGPGFGYPPPSTSWGRYSNNSDADQGISAFRDVASDTTWHSTISGVTPSFPLMGTEIWGSGGYAVFVKPNTLYRVAMSDLGPAVVGANEPFIVSLRVRAPNFHVNDQPTDFMASRTGVPTPSRAWIFYEHDSVGPSMPKGWQAIGGVNLNIWVAMTLQGTGTIRVEKTIDQNGNGIQESLDNAPLPSGVFAKFLLKHKGLTIDSALLGNNIASYTFCTFDTGAYTVQESAIPSGWIQTMGGIHTTLIHAPGVTDTARFMDFKLMTVSGTKFNDFNKDGVRGGGEPGIPGWEITVTGSGGGSVLTDVSGHYVLTGVGPGTHIISEEDRPFWVRTHPISGNYPFNALSGQGQSGLDFGNYDSRVIDSSLSGVKFVDANNNGVRDGTDFGLGGWKIYLFQQGSSTPMDSTVTNADGFYIFRNLNLGNFVIQEASKASWNQTFPPSGTYTTFLDGNQHYVQGLDFGNYRLVTSDTARTIITTDVIHSRPDSATLKAFEFHPPPPSAAHGPEGVLTSNDPLPAGSVVYSWDSAVVYTVTHPKYFYWLDIEGGLKFGHKCMYVFVDQATAAVDSVPALWWPVIKLPSEVALEKWKSWDVRVNSPDLVYGDYSTMEPVTRKFSRLAAPSARPSRSSTAALTGRAAILIGGKAESATELNLWQHDLDSVRASLIYSVPPAVDSGNVLMQNDITVDSLDAMLQQLVTCDTLFFFFTGHGDTSRGGGIVLNRVGGFINRVTLTYDELATVLFDSLSLMRVNMLFDASNAGKAIDDFMRPQTPVVNLVTSTDAFRAAGWGLPSDTESAYTKAWRASEREVPLPPSVHLNWRKLNDSVRARDFSLKITQNPKDTTNAALFGLAQASVLFPDVAVGDSNTLNLDVTNYGFIPLDVDSIAMTDPEFTIAGNNFATMSRNVSHSFPLRFKPTSGGNKSSSITFYHSGEAGPQVILAAGRGITAAETTKYRTFSQDSLALKAVKSKPYASKFCAAFLNNTGASRDGISVTFGVVTTITGSDSFPPPTTPDGGKTWVFDGTNIPNGVTVNICGIGSKGKVTAVKQYYWRQSMVSGTKIKGSTPPNQQLLLPMPNAGNVRDTVYRINLLGTGGIVVGVPQIPPEDKVRGWIRLPKSSNLRLYFNDKGILQTGKARPFDTLSFPPYKAFVKEKKGLSPKKYSNHLAGEIASLHFSIKASALGKTPVGLGELTYDDSTANTFNGLLFKEIADSADRMMTYKTGTPTMYVLLDSTISRINRGFAGAMDTVSFGGNLVVKGVRTPDDLQYVRASSIPPVRIIPSASLERIPDEYELYQNYPNPFNPTTTIQFDLATPAFVTLKVYNVLGQEVATLIDHVALDDGTQEAQFSAGNFASGVYFYRLVINTITDDEEAPSETHISVKKMLLMK